MTGRVDEKGRKNELRIFQAMSEDLEGWGGLRPSRSRPSRQRHRGKVKAYLLVASLGALVCGSGVKGSWPICYDYLADQSECPKIDVTGLALEDGTNEAVCFKTDYWKEFYPPPDCRNTGCRDDSTSGCCCGADSNVPGAKEPTSKECQDETKYGKILETGGAMAACPACKSGAGGDNGMGGRVQEYYGDPSLSASGKLDHQVYGHVAPYEYKLKACSSLVILRFQKWEAEVNRQCDVKTYLSLRKCGNCYRAICQFHNNLHWEGLDGKTFTCAIDLFLKRMQCYVEWYNKYCDCKTTLPTNDLAGSDVWKLTEQCTKTQPLFQEPVDQNGVSGIRKICSSPASFLSPPSLLLASALSISGIVVAKVLARA